MALLASRKELLAPLLPIRISPPVESSNELTPLTIARGYRFGNFKPSAVTVAAVEETMLSAGITPPTEKEEQATAFDIYAPKPAPPRRATPNP